MTTLAGVNDGRSDLFALRRTVIAGDDDLPTFAARVSGLTTRFNNLRRKPIGEREPDTQVNYTQVRAELDT